MANKVIGIEGLVGSGKTSICRELIKRYPNTVLLNGGNLYRSIVYAMMKNGSKLEELKAQGKSIDIKEMMDLFNVEIKLENQETIIYIDGEKVDEESIQNKEASMAVSVVGGSADNRKLFEFAHDYINKLKENYNVIVSGRSVMKIYPECDKHIFITASLDARVDRKAIQYNGEVSKEEIRENIEKRDELQRQAGFYDFDEITEELDVTDCKSIKESTDKFIELIGENTLN